MQRQQVGNVVRVQATKPNAERAKAVASRPVPLDAEALKHVAGGTAAQPLSPKGTW